MAFREANFCSALKGGGQLRQQRTAKESINVEGLLSVCIEQAPCFVSIGCPQVDGERES